MDSMPIRVPYKNLKHEDAIADVEIDRFEEEEANRRFDSDKSNVFGNGNAPNPSSSSSSSTSLGLPTQNCSMITLVLSCAVAAGVQFGWALQLSLLTPYIQTLGIGHAFSSFIWLCGPITGLVYATASGICNIGSYFDVVDVQICCIYNQFTILSSLCNSFNHL
ncbi:hypothetical protein Hdeb2414_s0305g00862011 [Helianthus debilis subsp. tardiflorus]